MHPRRGRASAQHRVALRLRERDEPLGGGEEAPGRAQGEAALGASRGHGDGPAALWVSEHHPAGDGVVGQEGVVEEDLGEALVTVEAAEAAHGHARRVERDEEVGQALVARAVGVGAEQPEEVGAEGTAGRPCLLAVEHPAAVDAAGLAGDAGQVAAGVGL